MSKTDREICILKWEQRFNYELDRLDPGNISHQRPFLKTMIKNTIEDLQAEIEQLKAGRDGLRCCGNCGHFEKVKGYMGPTAWDDYLCAEEGVARRMRINENRRVDPWDTCEDWQPKEQGE
jgi:hypothetical protein